MRKLLKWTNLILILVTLLSYLSPYLHPASFWFIALLGLAYPYLLLFNVLFILFWIMVKNKYFLFSLGCLLVGLNHFSRFVGIHPFADSGETEVVRVMTFNVHNLKDRKNNNKALKTDAIPKLISQLEPDVLCFQEFPWQRKIATPYAEAIMKNTSLKHFYQQDGGIAFFSRFPIKNKGGEYFPNHSNGYQFADIEVGGVIVRVYNIHLQTNAISGLADKVTSDGNLQEKETWLDIKGMLGRYRRSAGVRASQARALAAHIQQSPHPVIVCGDFNDVPQSFTYHAISKGLTDAFVAKGSGLGYTYAGKLPGLRIDYVLTAPRIEVMDHRIYGHHTSDHYPVIVDLSLPGSN